MNGEMPDTSFLDRHPWLLRILLALIFAAALGLRLFSLTTLPLDFQPDRQQQSMLKARGMYYAALSTAPAWQVQMAIQQRLGQPIQEPEIMEHLAALAYQLAGGEHLWLPRLFSILFWLVGGLALFDLIRAMVSPDGAIIGVLFYLFSYFGVIASRSFQPDPLMVMATILGLWALYRWYRHPTWAWTVAAGLLCGLAIYVKAPAVFFIAGGIGGLLFGDRGFKGTFRDPQVWVLGALALLPAVIYHILGTFILKFLGSGYYDLRIYPSLLKDPYYYLLWLGKIDQVTGLPAFLAALMGTFLLSTRRARALLLGLWAGYFIYGLLFIYYSGSHDYYTLPLYPLVAIGLGAVAQVVIERLRAIWRRPWIYAVVLALALVWVGQGAYAARNSMRGDYSSQVATYQKIGDEVRNYQVVGLVEDYTSRMQYYGWILMANWPTNGDFLKSSLTGGTVDLPGLFQKLAAGKDLFLVTDLGELDRQPGLKEVLSTHYAVFDKGSDYIIYDLRKPKS
jgi:hypothetical protein